MLMALKSSYFVFWTKDLNSLLLLGVFVYITQTWNSTCANLTPTGPNLTSIFPHKTCPVTCVPYFSYKTTSSHSPKLESWIFCHFFHPAFSIGYHVLEILLLLLPPVFQLLSGSQCLQRLWQQALNCSPVSIFSKSTNSLLPEFHLPY